jgi:hypothetical protein
MRGCLARCSPKGTPFPRNHRGGVAPTCGAGRERVGLTEDIGNDEGNTPVRKLIGRKILQPLREESGDIHIECGGRGKDLCITRPTETLVALRTIGWDIQRRVMRAPSQ